MLAESDGVFRCHHEKSRDSRDVVTAKGIVQDFIGSDKWTVIDRDADTLLAALDLVAQHGIHLWDAAIAATMLENDVPEIVTENAKDFGKIPQLIVSSPF